MNIDDILTGFVENVSDEVLKIATAGIMSEKAVVPPPLCSTYDKPVKEKAILEHKSRFK